MENLSEYLVLCEGVDIGAFWDNVYCDLLHFNQLEREYLVNGRRVKSENIKKHLSKKINQKNIEIKGVNLNLDLNYTAYGKFCLVHLKESVSTMPVDWIKLINMLGDFFTGRVYDQEYQLWQNTTDIEWFKLHNKPYEHLPILDRYGHAEIDCFRTKGRNLWRKGYIEAVASTMWLGDKFFELTGANKEAVKATDWLEVTEHSPGVLKIVAQDKPFTSDQGKEGELQDKLRDLLFPGHD